MWFEEQYKKQKEDDRTRDQRSRYAVMDTMLWKQYGIRLSALEPTMPHTDDGCDHYRHRDTGVHFYYDHMSYADGPRWQRD